MLTPTERSVLQWRYGLGSDDAANGMTLVEIAHRLGVSTQRVSQIESSALAKMRAELRDRGIQSLEDVI